MYQSKIALAAILVAAVTGSAGAADLPVKAKPIKAVEAPFFLVNENSLSYHYEFTATDPGAGYTPKNVATFSHFDVWAYGTNFLNIDFLKSVNGGADPTSGCLAGAACSGATEIYGFARSTLGWNELTHSKMFSAGPLKNISYAIGFDGNSENNPVAPAKKSFQGGLQADFATPYNGNLSLSAFAYKEYNHNTFAASAANLSGNTVFDVTWGLGVNYSQPLGFLPAYLPLTFKAIVGMHGPKGTGAPAQPQTKSELFTQETLDLDVGKMVTGKGGMFSVWTGYRLWKNKFGIDPAVLPFTLESTWLVGSTWAF